MSSYCIGKINDTFTYISLCPGSPSKAAHGKKTWMHGDGNYLYPPQTLILNCIVMHIHLFLIKHRPNFSGERRTIFIAHGWTDSIAKPWIPEIKDNLLNHVSPSNSPS